jgi:hypothetical protein
MPLLADWPLAGQPFVSFTMLDALRSWLFRAQAVDIGPRIPARPHSSVPKLVLAIQ